MTTATGIERVYCRVANCNGVILSRSYDGAWISRHSGRTLKIRGTVTLEADCNRGHVTVVRVDGDEVSGVL